MADLLEPIRKRSEYASDRWAEVSELRESADDVPHLVAALDAVLELAERWGPAELDEPYLLDPQTVIRLLREAITKALAEKPRAAHQA